MATVPPPPRRTGAARLARGLAWTLLGLLALGAGVVAFLHTPPGADFLRDRVAAALGARVNGTVAVGALDWSLGDDIVLSDLSVRPGPATPEGDRAPPDDDSAGAASPGPASAPDGLTLAELRLSPRWGSLLGVPEVAVTLTGLRLTATRTPDGRHTLADLVRPPQAAEETETPRDLVVTSLAVRESALTLRDPARGSLSVSNLAADGAVTVAMRSEGRLAAQLARLAGDLAWQPTAVPGATKPPVAVAAALDVSGAADARWPEGLGRAAGAGAAEVDGDRGPLPATASMTFAVKPTALALERGDTRHSLPLSAPSVALTLADGALALKVGPVTAGPARLEALDGRWPLAKTGEGQARLAGLKVAGEALSELVAFLGGPAGLVRADLQGHAEVSGPPAGMKLQGALTWGEAEIALGGEARLAPGQPSFSVTLDGKDIHPRALLGAPELPEVAAGFGLDLRLDGLPPDARLSTGLRLALGPGGGGPAEEAAGAGATSEVATLSCEVGPETLAVKDLSLRALGQTLRISGAAARATRTLEATVTSQLDLAALMAAASVTGATPEAGLAGLLSPRLSGLPDGAGGSATSTLTVKGQLSPDGLSALEAGATDLGMDALESMTVTGQVAVRALSDGAGRGLGSADLGLNLARGPGGLSGTLTVEGRDLTLDKARPPVDRFSLEVALAEGLQGTWRLRAAAPDLDLDLGGAFSADGLGAESAAGEDPSEGATMTVRLETLNLGRGGLGVTLAEPATAVLASESILLQPLSLRLETRGRGRPRALGSVTASGTLALTPPPAQAVAAFSGRLEGRALALGAIARALGGNWPAALTGAVADFTVTAEGPPDGPNAAWRLGIRLPVSPAFELTATGEADGERLAAQLSAGPEGHEAWLTGDLTLPLKQAEGRVGPDWHGPMRLAATLGEPSLGRWLAALGLTPAAKSDGSSGENRDGQLALALEVKGSLARPTGELNLKLDELSGFGGLRGGALRVEVAPGEGRALRLAGTVGLDGGDGRLGGASWMGEVQGPGGVTPSGGAAPVWRGGLKGQLAPARLEQALAGLGGSSPERPDGRRAPHPVRPERRALGLTDESTLSFSLRAGGRGLRATGELDWQASLTGGEESPPSLAALWPLSVTGQLRLDEAGGISSTHAVHAGGAGSPQLLVTAGARPLTSGRGGLLKALSARELARVGLEGTVTVPEAPLGDGVLGGALTLAGTLAEPTLEGRLTWQGYPTLDGTPGATRLSCATTAEGLRTTLSSGPVGPSGEAQPALSITVDAPTPGAMIQAWRAGLPVVVNSRAHAEGVPLRRLVPARSTGSPALAETLGGLLDLDLTLGLALTQGAATLEALGGGLHVSGLRVPIPNSGRVLEDGRLSLTLSPEAVRLEALSVRERDATPAAAGLPPSPERTLAVTGSLALGPGGPLGRTPTSATLRVVTQDFLIGGLAPDGPDAELDLDLAVAIPSLTSTPLAATLTFDALTLEAPDRFVRAHYPQFLSHGDILEAPVPSAAAPGSAAPEATSPPPLPRPRPPLPPLPDDLDLDVALVFPRPARLAAFPLDVSLEGRLDVRLAKGALTAHGRLDVARGLLGAMGWELPFEGGGISVDGGPETGLLDLTFAVAPPPVALRDASMAGGHGERARITARASLARGLETRFSGVGGPNVLDMATLLNTGRARLWGAPDLPPSATARFGNADHGLVLTFIATNLRHFIFMDRALGWSDSLVDHGAYGQLAWFDMQRVLPAGARAADGETRLWLRGRPVATGLNRLELGHEWLLLHDPRHLIGFGPRLGLDGRIGAALGWEWSSDE